jgi:hypothetical protein
VCVCVCVGVCVYVCVCLIMSGSVVDHRPLAVMGI